MLVGHWHPNFEIMKSCSSVCYVHDSFFLNYGTFLVSNWTTCQSSIFEGNFCFPDIKHSWTPLPLSKGGFSFKIFEKRGGDSDFSLKKGWVGKNREILLSLYQREVSVSKFSKKGEGIQIFPLKRDGLVKIGKLFLNKKEGGGRGGITYFHTN